MLKVWLSTCPDDFAGEYDQIEEMFHRGLSRLILNKRGPGPNHQATDFTYERWILSLPEEFKDKVWVRGTPDLADQLDVRGSICEARSLMGAVPESWKRVSTVAFCRTLDELQNLPEWLSGALVGPIFPSEFAADPFQYLTKDASLEELAAKLAPISARIPLIGWGGVDESNLPEVKKLPISGISLLGGIWNYADPVNAFIKLSRAAKL